MRRPWSEAETTWLKEHWPTSMSTGEMAKKLNRSVWSVRKKAKLAKLGKAPQRVHAEITKAGIDPSWQTINKVASSTGWGLTTVTRAVVSLRLDVRILQVKKGPPWRYLNAEQVAQVVALLRTRSTYERFKDQPSEKPHALTEVCSKCSRRLTGHARGLCAACYSTRERETRQEKKKKVLP